MSFWDGVRDPKCPPSRPGLETPRQGVCCFLIQVNPLHLHQRTPNAPLPWLHGALQVLETVILFSLTFSYPDYPYRPPSSWSTFPIIFLSSSVHTPVGQYSSIRGSLAV